MHDECINEVLIKKKRLPVWLFITIFVTAIAITVGVSAAAQNRSATRQAGKRLELARKYVSDLDYEQAILEYEASIKIDSKNVDAYLELANLYIAANRTEEAESLLAKASDIFEGEEKNRIREQIGVIREASKQENNETMASAAPGSSVDKVAARADALMADRSVQSDVSRPATDSTSQPEDLSAVSEDDEQAADNNDNVWTEEYNEGYFQYTNDDQGNTVEKEYHDSDGDLSWYGTSEYDDDGRITSETHYDADGEETYHWDFEYSEEEDSQAFSAIRYNESGEVDCVDEFDEEGRKQLTTTYDANGNVEYYWTYEHDDEGHEIASIRHDADGGTAYTTYTPDGEIIRETDYNPDGSVSEILEFNANGYVIKQVKYVDGVVFGTVEYERDGKGNPIKSWMYNSAGELYQYEISEYDATAKSSVTYAYNAEGAMLSYWTVNYDEAGRMIHELIYDAEGNPNYEWSGEYGENGELTNSEQHTIDMTESIDSDDTGNNSDSEIDNGSDYYDFEYDDLGRTIKQTDYSNGAITRVWTFEYDDRGNQAKVALYDSNGTLTEYYKYGYDDNGNMREVYMYDSNEKLSLYWTNEFDERGNVIKKAIYNADGSINNIQHFEYDDNNNLISSY